MRRGVIKSKYQTTSNNTFVTHRKNVGEMLSFTLTRKFQTNIKNTSNFSFISKRNFHSTRTFFLFQLRYFNKEFDTQNISDPQQGRDPWEALGVDRSATDKEIKTAYHQLVRKYHPDVNKSKNADKQFQYIQKAYAALKDAETKLKYENGELIWEEVDVEIEIKETESILEKKNRYLKDILRDELESYYLPNFSHTKATKLMREREEYFASIDPDSPPIPPILTYRNATFAYPKISFFKETFRTILLNQKKNKSNNMNEDDDHHDDNYALFLYNLTEDHLFSWGTSACSHLKFEDKSNYDWANSVGVKLATGVLQSIPSFVPPKIITKNQENNQIEEIGKMNWWNPIRYYRLVIHSSFEKVKIGEIQFRKFPFFPFAMSFDIYNFKGEKIAKGNYSTFFGSKLKINSLIEDNNLEVAVIQRKIFPKFLKEYSVQIQETIPTEIHPSFIVFTTLISHQLDHRIPSLTKYLKKIMRLLYR